MSRGTPLEYQDGETTCKGEYFLPENSAGPLPVVIVCHAWDGLGDEVRQKSARLAGEGYIALAADILGEGQFKTDWAELADTLGPFMADRQMLLNRLLAAVNAVPGIPGADPERIGVIGYCFGGTCALDLARSGGERIKAAVSFHGGLAGNGLETSGPITASVLVLHGHDDPMVPPEQVSAFEQEMVARQADWQLLAYGNTVHGFTRPEANKPEIGVMYNEQSDRRSWKAMCNFLEEVL